MTQNQISFYKAKEDQRHNLANEALTKEQNRINKKHLNRQDTYTSEHYERSDTAGLISANAAAMNSTASMKNADTNRKNYEMQYDIEYGWTNKPLTLYWYDPTTGRTSDSQKDGYLPLYNYPNGMPLSAQQKDANAMTALYEAIYKPTEQQLNTGRQVAEIAKGGSQAVNNVFNALYGKQGLVGVLDSIINE
jgi:hypothetical protein